LQHANKSPKLLPIRDFSEQNALKHICSQGSASYPAGELTTLPEGRKGGGKMKNEREGVKRKKTRGQEE